MIYKVLKVTPISMPINMPIGVGITILFVLVSAFSLIGAIILRHIPLLKSIL